MLLQQHLAAPKHWPLLELGTIDTLTHSLDQTEGEQPKRIEGYWTQIPFTLHLVYRELIGSYKIVIQPKDQLNLPT